MTVLVLSRVSAAISSIRRLLRSDCASVTMTFAVAVPVVFGVVGIAVDYSVASATHTKMQMIADTAAINSVREFQIARATADGVQASAQSYAKSQMNDISVQATADVKALTVNVVIEKDVGLTIAKVIGDGNMHLRVSATAKINTKLPLCVLALDKSGPATLSLEASAQMTANGCMVYSDSSNPSGLQAKDNAILVSGLTCTAGGSAKTSGAKLTPDAVTDCPRMDDPLASRAPPSVGPCSHTDTVISGGTEILQPGVYCRGLKITNGATVTLTRGIYVVKDGPLVVDKNATMQGTDVGFFLKGQTANLTFDTASTISLSAPKDGPMSGLLIYDDPTGASAPAIPYYPLPIPIVGGLVGGLLQIVAPTREHKILSDNARLLLGTIYMPKGRLIIDASKPIADRSAYTVLVVQRIDLHDGPNLVLNSDYSATDVPVPQGVGPFGKVLLAN